MLAPRLIQNPNLLAGSRREAESNYNMHKQCIIAYYTLEFMLQLGYHKPQLSDFDIVCKANYRT